MAPISMKDLKVAIVHDWLVGGGAELVVLELHHMFPEAPIYTSYCSDEWRKKLDNKVITGYLQRWPLSKMRKFLPVLRFKWFESLDFTGYDLVISSSGNGEALAIKAPKNTLHVNYCHAPTHYYWRFFDQYMQSPGFGIFSPVARLGLKILVAPLRKRDYKAAQRADYFIANSTHIKNDIKKYYGRDAEVIYPPVDTKRFSKAKPIKRHGFICAGRLVPQKRIDLAIHACNNLRLSLAVVGDGPERENLQKIAGPTITFSGRVSDAEMVEHIASAEALIFPSYEDFGIVPVEALAAGTPVIAYGNGGSTDYIDESKTGLLFSEQTVASLSKALGEFKPEQFSTKTLQAKASQFSTTAFQKHFNNFLKGKI